eukprot:TRINITY_DN3980_c0_g2_i1.p1 TRINITY_DN3980_c0_g2~~TRINITY_DN3980_c0_g2_i1.p1  ORF type:complete len:497 (-),score=109.39 TRINITY_DN3980_c0_g2_i1:49-1539(-)
MSHATFPPSLCLVALLAAVLFVHTADGLTVKHPLRPGIFKGALNEGLVRNGQLRDGSSINAAPEQWFEQATDHYDPQNTDTWKQRYYVNSTFFLGDGHPVLYMLGGEGPLNPTDVADHFILPTYAAKLGALIVSVEHRFYGASIPTANTSTANLRLLSSQQALADFAYFIESYSSSENITHSPWIVFGGSYSGALSGWFRLKYPHLVAGSIAASAPVFAEVNYTQYDQVVSDSIGDQCSQVVQEAFVNVSALIVSSPSLVESIFSACSPIESDLDVTNFLSSLEDGIAGVVQYNNDNNDYQPMNITSMCRILTTSSKDPLTALANFNNIVNQFYESNCTQVSYNESIAQLQNISNGDTAARAWTYQTCTEFGYYQTGTGSNQPFPSAINLEFYIQMCADIFGVPLVPNAQWTNTYYGARDPTSTNTAWTNGSIDPWHALGITNSSNLSTQSQSTALFMNGTAHCADLYPPRATDLPELTATRAVQYKYMQLWLASN